MTKSDLNDWKKAELIRALKAGNIDHISYVPWLEYKFDSYWGDSWYIQYFVSNPWAPIHLTMYFEEPKIIEISISNERYRLNTLEDAFTILELYSGIQNVPRYVG